MLPDFPSVEHWARHPDGSAEVQLTGGEFAKVMGGSTTLCSRSEFQITEGQYIGYVAVGSYPINHHIEQAP